MFSISEEAIKAQVVARPQRISSFVPTLERRESSLRQRFGHEMLRPRVGNGLE